MGRVLIIEDDAHVRDALTTILRDEGYDVEAHGDGRAALAHLDHGEPPDAILLDLMMPVMNGWQFRARQLAQPRLAQIPTIVMTASGNLERAAISADEIVLKPLKLSRLLKTLDRFVHDDEAEDDRSPTNPYMPAIDIADDSSWHLAAPAPGESCRWMDPTGKWISIVIGEDADIGLILVRSSNGKREAFDSYEEALRFSRSLRG